MTQQFVTGIELSRALARLLEPRLRDLMPQTTIAMALIGPGSDVLGFDTPRSMDHDWGPRLTVLVPVADVETARRAVDEAITTIPTTLHGFPLRYAYHPDGTLRPEPEGHTHRVHVTSIHALLQQQLGVDSVYNLTAAEWLCTPMQSLLEITSGAVFVDDTGELTDVRSILGFYPDDIWRYQLAAMWRRISQINPFVGRSGEGGDEVGSAIIAATLANDLMRIGLLQVRRYAPYSKWLGSAFARTSIGKQCLPHLRHLTTASTWQDREDALNQAGLLLVQQLNALSLIPNVPESTSQFHTRPFQVLPAEHIAHALHRSLEHTSVGHLPPFLGGIDAISDSTDARKHKGLQRALRDMLQSTYD